MPSEPTPTNATSTVASSEGSGSARYRGGARSQSDETVRDLAHRPQMRAGERVDLHTVDLPDVASGVDMPGETDKHSKVTNCVVGRDDERVGQVARPVGASASLRRIAPVNTIGAEPP